MPLRSNDRLDAPQQRLTFPPGSVCMLLAGSVSPGDANRGTAGTSQA